MPREPERPIEKLLRAFANKRREEAGSACELHPATRRMLQGEVARKFGAIAVHCQPLARPVLRLWPKLAWGLAACGILFIGVWVLRPQVTSKKPQALFAQ